MTIEGGQRGYVAGVIDCDGSIFVSYQSRYDTYRLALNVSNTASELPGWFKGSFGGSVSHRKPRSDRHSNEHVWVAYNKAAENVIRLVLPYLIVKRRQALLALEFASTLDLNTGRIPPSFKDIRRRVYEEMKALNMKGVR